MRDIVNAIGEEQVYIAEAELGQHSIDLLERLTQYGYYDLDTYFEDKNDYMLKQINFTVYYNENTDGIDRRVWQALENKESCIWVPKLTQVLACVGQDPFDYDKAAELGVGVLNMPHAGGTFITGPLDLTIGVHFPYNSDISYTYFYNKMIKYFAQYDIVPNNNDFMYDGKKVMGCSLNRTVSGMSTFFFSASFSDHSELVDQLCVRHSTKVPGFIPANILDREKMLSEVMTWVVD